MDDALLHALVDDRNGGAEFRGGGCGVALLEGFAQGAEGGAEVGAIGAVDGGFSGGLTGALERGNVVRHG